MNLVSLTASLTPQALANSSYWVLFFLIFFEGPVVTYIASFAASLGYLNVYVIFLLSSFVKIIPDYILFAIGKYGKKTIIEKYFQKKKMKRPILEKIEKNIKYNFVKTLAFLKIVPIVPVPGLIMVGASGVSTKKFLLYSTIFSIALAFVFTVAGYYTGEAYLVFMNYFKKIELAILATVILIFILWLLFRLFKKIIQSKEIHKFSFMRFIDDNPNIK